MKRIIVVLLSIFVLTACEEVKKTINSITNAENIAGLKEALTVGTNNATGMLGKKDGYLLDPVVKILLPEEAQNTLNAINKIQSYADEVPVIGKIIELAGLSLPTNFDGVLIEAVNRAAEDAAPEAADVFISAIKNMSINDATNILFTDNTRAATDYLETNTYSGLQGAFSPIISTSLGAVKVGDFTALSAWEFFARQNNKLAEIIDEYKSDPILSVAFNLLPQDQKNAVNSVKSINTDLGGYVTGRALDGVFVKVADEENKIRTDASARVSDLLQRVFGQLD